MINTFNKPITEIIKQRHSVRTYEDTLLKKEILQKVENYIEEINNSKGVFGGKIKVNLVKKQNGDKETKVGTYGVIKGANYYLTATYNKSEENGLYDLGYLFEKLILHLTDIGLGTVWLGGTFNKGNFAQAINLKEDELLPVVSPIGIESSKKTLISKMFGASRNKRKDFSTIFFQYDFNAPLTYEEAGDYKEVLENVRLSPSAVNKQPWRIIKENNSFHIYNEGKMEMSKIDIGIALCHFQLSAEEKGLAGQFKVLDNKINDNYVISWVI